MKKLSKPMEDMVKAAEIHEIRINGEIVRHGYIVAGNANTVVALMGRGVCTASDAANHGFHWITDDGMKVWAELTGNDLPVIKPGFRAIDPATGQFRDSGMPASPVITDADAAEMWADRGISARSLALAIEGGMALLPADVRVSEVLACVPAGVALAESILRGEVSSVSGADMWILDETVDAVNAVSAGIAIGQIERAWDAAMSEDHLTVSDMITDIIAIDEQIRQDVELDERLTSDVRDRDRFDIITEAFDRGRLMIMTRKNVIVSQSYIATMARIADVKRVDHAKWAFMRDMVANAVDKDLFAELDTDVAAGKMSFRNADKGKRIARKIIRPTLGCKHKPSKKRR